jgi:hypothetical protein
MNGKAATEATEVDGDLEREEPSGLRWWRDGR